ncbi:creatininase family protein [Aestuariivirga litoralis]|uniref:creatininase family protein n=1 Tax=Aestuariivirga litoralis TaxID=2650924 RepID=UPI0018C658E8|nr:creatininase family protein [Aestuariivirga litoralis]MBG1231262.1 creatininase family protein [Aestuariivirga litoralis]
MRYELMLPHQLRQAIANNTPVVLPLGVLEYHGEHLGLGMDTLVVIRMLELVEKQRDIVILPPFYYGAASYAVEKPEGNGSVQVNGKALAPFAEELFYGLLKIGFRNIHGIIHHQSENFANGMPTDLSFRLGARQACFRFVEEQRGEGWWGKKDMAAYYAKDRGGDDPFNLVKIHPLMSREVMEGFPFDHAGIGETSLMMALCPEAVDMARHRENKGWYTETAAQASTELGTKGRDLILKRLLEILV